MDDEQLAGCSKDATTTPPPPPAKRFRRAKQPIGISPDNSPAPASRRKYFL